MKAVPWMASIVLAMVAAVMFRYQMVEVQTPSGKRLGTMDRWTGRVEPTTVDAPTPRADSDTKPQPPPWTNLRVKSLEKIPFRIKFMGAPSVDVGDPYSGDTQFSLNTLDYSSPTQFLQVGDKIAGTELMILKAESKKAIASAGVEIDVSELTVKDAVTGDVIVLVAGQEVDSPYFYAILVDTITGAEIRTEKGKAFTFGPDKTVYELTDELSDASEEFAYIKNVAAGEIVSIPKLGAE